MFGSIGLPELLLIFIIALLLFGPRKLPEIGRTLGRAMNEFKRATNDLQRSLEEEVAADELKQTKREVEEAARLAALDHQPVANPPAPAGTVPGSPAAGTAGTAPPDGHKPGPTETA